jgi:hypothetical protein
MRKVMSWLLVLVMVLTVCGCEVSDEVTIEKDNAIVSDSDNGENPQGKKISVEEEKERIEKARETEKAIEEQLVEEETTVQENEAAEETSEEIESDVEVTEPVSSTVYRTETGECYHKEWCQYLKSKIEITVDNAKAIGLRPCSKCNP